MTTEDIPNPPLRALFAYWDSKCAGRAMPDRRDLDPLDMKAWLGSLILVDVVDDGADFRYRLHGSVLTDRIGADLTGQCLSSVIHVFGASAMAEYRDTYRRRAPLLILASSYINKPYIVYDKLVLPLSAVGGAPTMLLAGIYPAAAATDAFAPPHPAA